jgi:hypothetical protein
VFSPIAARAALYEEYEIKASVNYGHLDIVSFSEKYDKARIHEIYLELLNNFHSQEFEALDAIYLYPDAPLGVAGQYFEDIYIDRAGNYGIGDKSYIELFNMNKKTPAEIAPVLAHEYGHHYTISNITVFENKYYSAWKDTQYGTIRSFSSYPVVYEFDAPDYAYRWDVTEIAANDYVQLLGSPNARASWLYQDAEQRLLSGNKETYVPVYFNMRPQENYQLPLASDATGLMQYLLAVGGYTGALPPIGQKPKITAIVSEESFLNEKYTIYWDKAVSPSEKGFEYTVVMFPADFPILSIGIKTVADGGETKAVFGSVTKKNDDGSLSAILDYYTGTYVFRVYAKDERGYIYASEDFYYDFGHDFNDTSAYLKAVVMAETTATMPRIEALSAGGAATERQTPIEQAVPSRGLAGFFARQSEEKLPNPQGERNANATDIDLIFWRATDEHKGKRCFLLKSILHISLKRDTMIDRKYNQEGNHYGNLSMRWRGVYWQPHRDGTNRQGV